MVASMFVNWVDVEKETHTGLGLAWNASKWLFLVPILGLALAITAAARSEATRLAAIAAGLCVSGYVLFHLGDGMLKGGWETWLMFGGAGAMIAGTKKQYRAWRAIGGVAVLAGFFAPWADHSMWDFMRSVWWDAIVEKAPFVRVFWLVPVAGLAGLGSALSSHDKSGRVSLIAGLAVFGAFAYAIGALANMIFAWGAWAAFGASTFALVVGVLAPAGAAVAATATKPAKTA
jgi:hypothetical protein